MTANKRDRKPAKRLNKMNKKIESWTRYQFGAFSETLQAEMVLELMSKLNNISYSSCDIYLFTGFVYRSGPYCDCKIAFVF